MSITVPGHTAVVTETQWERLRRLIDLRRDRLDLTLAGVHATGGPSPKWVHKLSFLTGPPSERQRASLSDLDRALRWDVGTSWGLVADDRSDWSEERLAEEEETLLNKIDEANNFGFLVATRLRAIPEGPERDAMMRAVLDVLEVRP